MSELLARLLQLSTEGLLVGFIVFLRIGAAMAVLPAFGEHSVPKRIKVILALSFTILVAPAVFPTIRGLMDGKSLLGVFLFTEVLIGLTVGFGLRLFIFALQMAGSIAAQSTSLSQIFGGSGVDPQPAIGHIMVVSGLAIAVTMGLHVYIVKLFVLSYSVFQPGEFLSGELLSTWGVSQITHAFGLAFTLAAPFVIASLVYNIALGVINRAMPQLMVAFVGAPAITAGGLILLFVALPILLSVWKIALLGFFENPFG